MRTFGIALAEIGADHVVAERHICTATAQSTARLIERFLALECTGNARRDNCPVQKPLNQSSCDRRDLVHNRTGISAGLCSVLIGHQPQHVVVIELINENWHCFKLCLSRCHDASVTTADLDFAISASALNAPEETMIADRLSQFCNVLVIDWIKFFVAPGIPNDQVEGNVLHSHWSTPWKLTAALPLALL